MGTPRARGLEVHLPELPPRPAPVFLPEALDPEQAAKELRDAAKRGDEAKVRRLIAEGVPVDAKNVIGQTPLHRAAGKGHIECIRALVELSASIDAKTSLGGLTPLHFAARAEVHGHELPKAARVPVTHSLRITKGLEQRTGIEDLPLQTRLQQLPLEADSIPVACLG